MAGNVWEGRHDWYSDRHPQDEVKPCCVPRNPRGAPSRSHPAQPQFPIPRKVIKGGLPARGQLSHALPAGGQATADDRHRHEPHRLSLRLAPDRCRESWRAASVCFARSGYSRQRNRESGRRDPRRHRHLRRALPARHRPAALVPAAAARGGSPGRRGSHRAKGAGQARLALLGKPFSSARKADTSGGAGRRLGQRLRS